MQQVQTDPMQGPECLYSVGKDLHNIISSCVTRILQNWRCDTFRLSRSLQFLVNPVGQDMHVASPNRSHAVPCMPVICLGRPAQDNVTPCDKNCVEQ